MFAQGLGYRDLPLRWLICGSPLNPQVPCG